MAKVVEGLYYSKEHEWVKVDGDKAFIGITDYAQHSLGEIVFVELPELDSTFTQGETFSVVESVKAASDIYIPISGTVLEVNEDLEGSPESLNEDAYGSWIAIVSLDDESELDSLLSATDYEAFCK